LAVYDISVLSNIPLAVADLLSSTAPPQRLRPLFCIGVHDIPLLEDDLRAQKAAAATPGSEDAGEEKGCGWIACTTDSILAMKSSKSSVSRVLLSFMVALGGKCLKKPQTSKG